MNISAAANISSTVGKEVTNLTGHWSLILGAILLLVIGFLVIYFLKNLIAHAVVGVIGLLIVKYALGMAIPINGLTLLVSIFGGLWGVAALLIAAFLGWL